MICFTEPPGPPINLKVVDSTKTSITLGWGKPLYDGGAPIIGYVVEMRPKTEKAGPNEGWKRCNVAAQVIHTEFTVMSLDEKELYEFRVSAQNQVGIGPPADLKEAVSPKEILGNFPNQPLNYVLLIFYFAGYFHKQHSFSFSFTFQSPRR